MAGTVSAARGSRAGPLAAYAAGLALAGGAFFAALGALGAWVSLPLTAALFVAAAAAVADLAGLRVRPQVRLQVPERWRRTMPLPQALFLYGLLLGTGFTTFVPAAAAWALLPLSVATGNVAGGAAIGLSFAAGRALPVVALRSDETALAERPQGLRAVRVLAAASLVFALAAGEASAAGTIAKPAGDPSVAGSDLAWEQPAVGGFLLRNGQRLQLPGKDPALGGSLAAWHSGDAVTVAARDTLVPSLQLSIPGVDKLAVSDRWLVYRAKLRNGAEEIAARAVTAGAQPVLVAGPRPAGRLGRPSLSGDLVVYHLATPGGSWLKAYDLAKGTSRTLRFSRSSQLLNPSLLGSTLLYVRASRCSQQLRLGALGGGSGRVLYELAPLAGQDRGHERRHTRQGAHLPCPHRPRPTRRMLWTTALGDAAAYLTVIDPRRGGRTTPTLLSVAVRR